MTFRFICPYGDLEFDAETEAEIVAGWNVHRFLYPAHVPPNPLWVEIIDAPAP